LARSREDEGGVALLDATGILSPLAIVLVGLRTHVCAGSQFPDTEAPRDKRRCLRSFDDAVEPADIRSLASTHIESDDLIVRLVNQLPNQTRELMANVDRVFRPTLDVARVSEMRPAP
jgi:hypothetical protein